jgi:PAS domain S-box-containing protein
MSSEIPISQDPLGDARDALETSHERYAALVERAGYGVYRSSSEGRFTEVNSALVGMLGYSSVEDLLRLDLARDVYLDADERERLRRRPTNSTFPNWSETRWKRRDGSAITVKLSARPVMDADGKVVAYDGIVEDVTERHRHDELLRRSERMASIGTTLAGVAHELNNPLAAIMGFAQLLLKRPWAPEDRSALETIHHEATRAATIVKDLLAMARKRAEDRRVATNVNDIVGYVFRTRRYALETAGVTCTLELDPAVPMVYGDRAQIEQVMLNLLNNAEHALQSNVDERPHDAWIRICTRHDQAHVIIEVEDNGQGIPASERSHIWDPFWTTKDEGEGTGLGLAVAHSIVVDHGGSITLDTASSPENTPNAGARFVIRLPIAREPATPAPLGHASRPLDVLVVDPEASDLLFVERFLTSRGHVVINAGSGELAVRLASQTAFDAVLCDARLIGRDGMNVATALRATSGGADARFVLSAATPIDSHQLHASMRSAALVTRPYDVEELRRLIEGD